MRRRLALAVVLFASRAYAQQPPPDAGTPPPPDAPSEPATPTPPSEPPKTPGADLTPTDKPATPTTPTTPPTKPDVAPPASQNEIKHTSDTRIAAQRICDAHSPDCNWISTFSSLERVSIRRTLESRGLEPDPMPWGKIVNHIIVVNEDVFAERGSIWSRRLAYLNFFHVTTTSGTIRRELTFDEGAVYNPDLVAESARRLKDPLFTSVVAILPVKASVDGQVDVLVVTRDIWSLRFNTKWTIQEKSLTGFQSSLSENNFLGRRKTVAFGFVMDQASIDIGPLYIDKNFLGEHLDFRIQARKILTRKSLDIVVPIPMTNDLMRFPSGDPEGIQDGGGLHSEGSDGTISLSKPLWSLASTWGGGGSFAFSDAISRRYYRTGLRAYDDPNTPDPDNLAREYRLKSWKASANATHQWGDTLKQQVQLGYAVSSTHPSLLPNFTMDPMLRMDFIRDVFPHNEVVSGPFAAYSLYLAKFKTVRNIDTYELAEDVRMGPDASVSVSQSVSALGSTVNFTEPSFGAGWTFPWGDDGFVRVSGNIDLRIQPNHTSAAQGMHDTIDNTASAQIRASTPTLSFMRLIAQVHTETLWHDTQNGYFSLGSESGLRAYGLGSFIGDRRIVGQLEARGTPFPFWVFRVGGVVFYEGGGAANSFNQMALFHDVGFGLRALVPQSSRELFRFDLAFPLVSGGGVTAGIPNFTAGFDSYF